MKPLSFSPLTSLFMSAALLACVGCASPNSSASPNPSATPSEESEYADAAPEAQSDSASILSEAGLDPGRRAVEQDASVVVTADSCGELFGELAARAEESASCARDKDCVLADVDCLTGFGACNLITSVGFDIRVIGAYERAAYDMGCAEQSIGVCECPYDPPPKCQDGQCVPSKRCGQYDLSERWTRQDGVECYCDAHLGERCRMCGEYYVDDQWENDDGCICRCSSEGTVECGCR